MADYIMEGPGEGRRLEEKTSLKALREQLDVVGPSPGMRVLDAGGGTGAVARVLAERVGPTGEVVVIDRSAERLAEGERLAMEAKIPNMRFLQRDLEQPPLNGHDFDYVWCRFLFEYLPDPLRVLRNLCAFARVDGKVVVGDLDGNGVNQYPPHPVVDAGIETILRCLAGRFDPFVGRKLVHLYYLAGIRLDAVHLFPYHVYSGAMGAADLRNWREKFAVLRRLCMESFGGAPQYDHFVESFFRHACSPGTFMYSTLVLTEGTRAA